MFLLSCQLGRLRKKGRRVTAKRAALPSIMGRPRGGGLAAALKRKKKGSKKHKGERKRKKAVLREDSESEV